MTPSRVAWIGLGTLTAALLLAHGTWLVLVALVTALDTDGEPT